MRVGQFLLLGGAAVLIFVAACTSNSASSYTVSARNISPDGEFGIILIDFPATLQREQKDEGQQSNEVYLYPWVSRRNFGAFEISRANLPDSIRLQWQLARLSDCQSVDEYESPPGHVRKRFCIWHPVETKKFTKVVNLTTQKNSEAFKSKGEFKGFASMNQKTARLTFVFADDQVRVGVEAGATNPWK